MRRAFLVISKDSGRVQQMEWSGMGAAHSVYVLRDTDPPAINYRRIQDAFPHDVWGICHDDVHFGPGALETLYAAAEAGAVAGIVGRSMQARYMTADAEPGEVSCLDGCAIFFRPCEVEPNHLWATDHSACMVEDMCLQAHAKGIPVIVPGCDAHHRALRAQPGMDRKAWLDAYWGWVRKLEQKWGLTLFRDFYTT